MSSWQGQATGELVASSRKRLRLGRPGPAVQQELNTMLLLLHLLTAGATCSCSISQEAPQARQARPCSGAGARHHPAQRAARVLAQRWRPAGA